MAGCPTRRLASRDRLDGTGSVGPYRAAFDTALPPAKQVADPFHVVKLANNAVDEVRRRVQNHTLGHHSPTQGPFLHSTAEPGAKDLQAGHFKVRGRSAYGEKNASSDGQVLAATTTDVVPFEASAGACRGWGAPTSRPSTAASTVLLMFSAAISAVNFRLISSIVSF